MMARHKSKRAGSDMNIDRRIDTLLAGIVDKGFAMNFSRGFRDAGAFLRVHQVSAKVIVRVINYGPRRAFAAALPPMAEHLPFVAPVLMHASLTGTGETGELIHP